MAKSDFKFGTVPKVNYRRSKFDLSFNKRFSMSVGSLYPFYLQEIYPGDTFKVNAKSVIRTSSAFLKPVMDNLFLDTYYFFVPNRLVYDKWAQVMGENTQSAWAPVTETRVPVLASSTVSSKTVADYLGLPLGTIPAGVSRLPFRAFALIYNEWFRDQNNIDPVFIHTDDKVNVSINSTLSNDLTLNNADWSASNYLGKLPKVAKFHDYFTTCLPDTQKSSEPVSIGLAGYAPVVGVTSDGVAHNYFPLQFQSMGVEGLTGSPGSLNATSGTSTNPFSVNLNVSGSAPDGILALLTENTSDINASVRSTLNADLSDVTGISVNDLRYAVQLQKMLEKDARTGTRYKEVIEGHFGVISPDARLQRPEYLGGNRTPINIQQVPQTSQSTTESPLAQLGAYSFSNTSSRYTKSFVEHGFVIGVCCLRQFHTYQQGIEKFWTRSQRYDFYDPLFAHLGEQAVYKSELYAKGLTDLKGSVFGYNEAWADLRYRPSQTAGEMRSDATNSLDIWHFGDDYSNAPTLNAQFINETPVYVDRTLAVPSTSQDQFIVDTYFKQIAYRVLPTYSVPGYVDHDFT